MRKMPKDSRAQSDAAQKAIAIAAEHVSAGATSGMRDSAALRLDDARTCLGRGDYRYAVKAAKDSVDYSLGAFSAESKQIAALLG